MKIAHNIEVVDMDEGMLFVALARSANGHSQDVTAMHFFPKVAPPDTRRWALKPEHCDTLDEDGVVVWGPRNPATGRPSTWQIYFCAKRRQYIARHADNFESSHDSLPQAHDALIGTGSPSPLEVTGRATP